MKHLITLLIAGICLLSCSKEVTYSITNKTGMAGTAFIHECNESGETVNIQNATINDSSTKSFVANKNAVKIKIYIKELDRWVQQVFYFETTTHITIDGNTIVGVEEP